MPEFISVELFKVKKYAKTSYVLKSYENDGNLMSWKTRKGQGKSDVKSWNLKNSKECEPCLCFFSLFNPSSTIIQAN